MVLLVVAVHVCVISDLDCDERRGCEEAMPPGNHLGRVNFVLGLAWLLGVGNGWS